MTSRGWHWAFLAVFAAFLLAFIRALDAGMLGHDYFYFFSKLLEGKWHILRQGPLPMRWTPHYCGGMPQYGNPQDVLYSLPQILVFFLHVWNAVKLTMIIALIAGYAGWYRVGKDIIRVSPAWSHVLALIVSAHGFYFMHMIPGHLVFHTGILIGWLVWLFFQKDRETTRNLWIRSAWFALTVAAMLYSGGYLMVIMAIFALGNLLPVDLILHATNRVALRQRTMTLLRRLGAFGSATLLLCVSKLVAVWSFMRFLPRIWPFERFPDGVSALAYLLKAFFWIPQSDALFEPYGMPNWGSIHEYSMFISPVVLVGIAALLWLGYRRRTMLMQQRYRTLSLGLWIHCSTLFFAQFARGYGLIVTPMEDWPVMESLHVNTRYLYAYSFLVILGSVWALHRLTATYARAVWVAFGAAVLSVLGFVVAYGPMVRGETARLPLTLPWSVVYESMLQHGDYLELSVDEMFDMRGLGHSELVPLYFGGNDIYCHEPVFLGDGGFAREELLAGPVSATWDNGYNMYNPACMQYPEQNGCKPGSRIAADDGENLEKFTQGKKSDWKLSPLQRISDVVSMLTLLGCTGLAAFSLWRRR